MYDGIKCRGPAKRLEKCFVMCPNAAGVPSDPIPEKSNNDGKEIAPLKRKRRIKENSEFNI